jgi:ATP/maltotriose-dependent transcriptional regulator MalT
MNFRRALPSAQLLLSDIYVERGEMERALEYCQLAEELATEMDLQNYLVFVSLTRGDIASRQGRLTEARERFEKALELAKQLNNAFAIAAANEKLKLLDSAG